MINNTSQIIRFDQPISVLIDGTLFARHELRPGERCLGDAIESAQPATAPAPAPDEVFVPDRAAQRERQRQRPPVSCPCCGAEYVNNSGLSGHVKHQHPEYFHNGRNANALLYGEDDYA